MNPTTKTDCDDCGHASYDHSLKNRRCLAPDCACEGYVSPSTPPPPTPAICAHGKRGNECEPCVADCAKCSGCPGGCAVVAASGGPSDEEPPHVHVFRNADWGRDVCVVGPCGMTLGSAREHGQKYEVRPKPAPPQPPETGEAMSDADLDALPCCGDDQPLYIEARRARAESASLRAQLQFEREDKARANDNLTWALKERDVLKAALEPLREEARLRAANWALTLIDAALANPTGDVK